MEKIETIILGKEYDDVLIKRIKIFLTKKGISIDNRESGLAGSQEYQSFTFKYMNAEIKLEIETYIGISITGEKNIVEDIQNELNNFGSVSL